MNYSVDELAQIALAFIGGPMYGPERIEINSTPIVKSAEEIGIIVSDPINDELNSIETLNGKVYLYPDIELTSEYDVAVLVGSYILFRKTPSLLTKSEFLQVNSFAVIACIPNIMEFETLSTSDNIKLSREASIPFFALNSFM